MENIKKYILENHKNHCTVKVSSNSSEDEILNKIAEKVMCGGILLKLENSDMADGDFLEFCKKVKQLCAEFDALLIIAKRPDLAHLCHADGIFLGEHDINIHDAQEILGKDAIIGVKYPQEEADYCEQPDT